MVSLGVACALVDLVDTAVRWWCISYGLWTKSVNLKWFLSGDTMPRQRSGESRMRRLQGVVVARDHSLLELRIL